MATLLRRGSPALLMCFAALVPMAAGCSAASRPPARTASSLEPPPAPITEHVVNGRFTVTFSGTALQQAKAAGFNLPALTAHALAHINALLPGPGTTITVGYARGDALIAQAGVYGYTYPKNAHISAGFGATSQVTIGRALTFWFPRDLAHEVNHSVRNLAGPGFGPTLLPQLITEGMATVFDQAAFPGPADPWTNAITRARECALWKKARPQLGYPGVYDLWMFGGHGVPHWTGFTIGYRIVKGYLSRHPDVSWAALAATSAATILAGSHYQPCPG